MARTAITVNSISRAGLAPVATAAGDVANGNSVANDGAVFLHVENTNGDATARTLTISLAKTVDGQAPAAKTYEIDAGDSLYIGPFPTSFYGDSLAVDADNAELKLAAYHL